IGFDVSQEGVFIYLPDGSVEVLYACTGGPLIGLLLQLTFVLFIIAPLNWKFASKILIGLLSLGFFLGVVRVALLAVVVSDDSAFDYWHG
ncbi:archaeosortase/exosortase family protein, partial [Planococcus sp. SIMBA_160]